MFNQTKIHHTTMNLWSTDIPRVRHVAVSDTCRVWHWHL